MKQKSNHLRLVNKQGEMPGWKKAIRFIFRLAVIIAVLLLLKQGETFFRVSDIRVVGAGEIPSGEIIAAGGMKKGINIFLFREEKITGKIREQFPQVKTIVITRELPDSVVIEIAERNPVGYTLTADGFAMIDSDTVSFACSGEKPVNYPLISGIPEELVIPGHPLNCPARRAVLTSFFAAWSGIDQLEIDRIDLTEKYNLVVHTVDGWEIWLGDGKEMEHKLALVQQSIPHISADSEARLDARSGKRLVVSKSVLNREKEVEP